MKIIGIFICLKNNLGENAYYWANKKQYFEMRKHLNIYLLRIVQDIMKN